jgi:hypothetical protein
MLGSGTIRAAVFEEEMRNALKATEVTPGVKSPMPPHHPPMGTEDMPPGPPHIKKP